MKLIRTFFFFFQAEDGIRDRDVTGVQTCALPILAGSLRSQVEEFITKDAVAAKCVVHAEGARSEERRVGKEGRSRWSLGRLKKNTRNCVMWTSIGQVNIYGIGRGCR